MLGARLRLARYVATACKLTVAVASQSFTDSCGQSNRSQLHIDY